MSMMGELTFILGIQVKQTKQGTFMHQVKYMKDLLKKFNMVELKHVSTLMSTATSLGLDKDGDAVDQREYMSMIDSLLYLTTTRSDIQFTVELCACFQASPCSSHQTVVQQVFRYLKYTSEFEI
jgi:isopentenyldiphosphate isomerase